MPEAIIWEFDGVGRAEYEAVNEKLGIDTEGDGYDMPEGMLHHTGAEKPGGLVVFEVWESKEAQERFVNEQLMPALSAAGVTTQPTRVEWLIVAATTSPGSG
jgi:hypothetical protein